MALVPSSFDPEDAFVQLVRVAHSLQSECSDYTYLHPTFTVPSEAPWPVEWAGRDVDVSAFREAYCVGQLRAETVAQLSALRFVWDDDLEALKWKVHLGALFTYKTLYGNVAIPPSFHIPVTAAAADPPWSKDIRRSELHLGAIAHALRLNRSTMPELQRDQLDHIGFVWDLADVEWAIRLAALTAFKHIHGHLHVPTTFVVPDGDPAWPAPTFNLPLGWVVVSLRLKKNSLASDRVQLLTKLGFVFKPWRVATPLTTMQASTRNVVASNMLAPPFNYAPSYKSMVAPTCKDDDGLAMETRADAAQTEARVPAPFTSTAAESMTVDGAHGSEFQLDVAAQLGCSDGHNRITPQHPMAAAVKQVAVTAISLALGLALTVPSGLTRYTLLSFGMNWFVCLVHAIPNQSERYFDLTGSGTFLTVAFVAAAATLSNGAGFLHRPLVASAMVAVWALRLGTFLFSRITSDRGIDSRFAHIRSDPVRFLSVWSVQSLWVLLTTLPILLLHGAAPSVPWTTLDVVGIALWALGFACEVVADVQKTTFRRDKANHDKFIASGLWRYSRHPNYFGEITLWVGVALVCVPHLPTLSQQLLGLLSPLFVAFLLNFVSGIPLLEKKADDKWGTVPAYQQYKASTNVLVPWFPASP
ncbi:hypothetical protein DYB32_006000 [Aphanomyces invadans]|uniref:Helicase-associated domain-containing protein n=1 Tax=Aphanomyces invadans TaxID=157072 RepID=A0A418AVU8_9STRA|nr:hypothetical protein DYB32_006000 [Aphanomyces invadans]